MKHIIITVFLAFNTFLIAQSNTDVHLFEVNLSNNKIELINYKNISNNEGYDNQPSFLNDERILYASTRNGQTDIMQYFSNYGSKVWLNFSEGGEYSPLKIPNKNAVSAVRLDKDGKQALYSYNLSNGESTQLIEDLIVAYYTWYDDNTVVSAVIEGEDLNLYKTNIKEGTSIQYDTKVGRSFHKIPNSNLVSYISKKSEKEWQIRSLNPLTGKTRLLANTMPGVEDICWLNGNTLLSGKDSILYKLKLKHDNNWKQVTDLSSNGIIKITRLAVNQSGSKLLIAGDIDSSSVNQTTEETVDETNENNTETNNTAVNTNEELASQIVQKHIEPFNTRNLDAFANAFDADITVNRFPNEKMYSGRNTLKENYKQFFKNNKKSNVTVLNRITHKNIVIDEELVTLNNTTNRQVTIYETDAENINSMTFIRNSNTTSNPEAIINKQLEVYNNRDIDGFVKTYTKDIKLYTFPNKLDSEGHDEIRKGYAGFFKSVPDLNAEIVNRIVLGNKVIDKEKVLINGKIFYAIAIYEVENGLISKVTFIQ